MIILQFIYIYIVNGVDLVRVMMGISVAVVSICKIRPIPRSGNRGTPTY